MYGFLYSSFLSFPRETSVRMFGAWMFMYADSFQCLALHSAEHVKSWSMKKLASTARVTRSSPSRFICGKWILAHERTIMATLLKDQSMTATAFVERPVTFREKWLAAAFQVVPVYLAV